MKKRIFGLWMLILLLLLGTGAQAAPKMNASITKSNVLALAKATDADSFYILQSGVSGGDNILSWWQGENSVAGGMDTGVHEQFHAYTFRRAPWDCEDIYIGNQKYIRIKYTNVFPSKQMASTIPSALRTFRWGTYVGNPVANMASNKHGPYGLLNEFSAYYWGMHAQMAMFDYYKSQNAGPAEWTDFVLNCANDRMAYAEFKYYILHYLYYAKQHSPSVYQGIVNNSEFKRAYQTIEQNFAALIDKFEKRLDDISAVLKKSGYDTIIGDSFMVGKYGFYSGVDLFQKDYQNLLSEIKKSSYRNILEGTGSTVSVQVKSPSLSSVKSSASGKMTVKWKKVSGASGYQIRYSQKKNFSSAKKVSAGSSATSKKISSLKKGKTYYVSVRAYKTKSGKKYYSDWSAAKTVKIAR